jgi:hypothetical protein
LHVFDAGRDGANFEHVAKTFKYVLNRGKARNDTAAEGWGEFLSLLLRHSGISRNPEGSTIF